MPYYLDNTFLLDNPVDHRGGLRWHRRLSWPRASAASSRAATPPSSWWTTTGWSPTTCLRQNFYPENVGKFKSQALADRLAKAYNRPIGYSVYPFREEEPRYPGLSSHDGLIIGCADNAAARRAMAECLPGDPCRWLIDAGNDTNWGQVLIGNIAHRVVLEEPPFTGETCLPGPGAHPATPRPADGGVHQAA